MLTARDGAGRTPTSRVGRGSVFNSGVGSLRWSSDYMILPNGQWVRKHARPRRDRQNRRAERQLRRAMHEGRSAFVVAALSSRIRSKLTEAVRRLTKAGARAHDSEKVEQLRGYLHVLDSARARTES